MDKHNVSLVLISCLLSFNACDSISPADPCDDVDCKHGGECESGICNCTEEYTGVDCDIEVYSDEQALEDAAWGIMSGVVDIYNQNLAGKPTGAQDQTFSGPIGGSVHVTGVVTFDNTHSITTVNLNLAFDNCKISAHFSPLTVNLTLNNSLQWTGSFNSPSFFSESYIASNIDVNGTVTRDGITKSIDETCTLGLTRNTNSTSGEFCDVSVAW